MELQTLIGVNGPRINFPTFCACAKCHGIKCCLTKNGFVYDKALTFQAALIQHGYYLNNWEGQNISNKSNFPKMCSCKCDHDFISKTVGTCLHELTCKKCNETITVDSSD